MVRPERIEVIRAALMRLIDECMPWKNPKHAVGVDDPVLVAMEAEIFLGSAVTNSDQTALQAILQSAFYYELKGAEFLSINVAHVKKYINAKQKDEILLRVFQRYKVEFTNHNQADAFVLAQIANDFVHYRHSGTTWPELIKPQHEVLDKLLQQPKSWEILKRRVKKGKGKKA